MKDVVDFKNLKLSLIHYIRPYVSSSFFDTSSSLGLIELYVIKKYLDTDDNKSKHRIRRINYGYTLLYNDPTCLSIGSVIFNSTVKYKNYIRSSAAVLILIGGIKLHGHVETGQLKDIGKICKQQKEINFKL